MAERRPAFRHFWWLVLLTLALSGCDRGNATSSADASATRAVTAPRATTTALPERTNNAWEMQPFRLRDLEGNLRSLSDWKGKVIMMNFWASWCAPCQYEIPEFVRYQKEYGSRGLQVIGIGVDEQRKLANVARSLGINYPVLILQPSVSRPLMARWGDDTGLIPYTVVIARDGRIKYIHRGQMGTEEFDTYVKPLL